MDTERSALMSSTSEWVGTDSLDTRIYRESQELFDLEVDKIWRKTWVYLGHTSEIEEAGDYVRRQLGTDPVIVVRQDDVEGSISVLLNRCAHRGNTVCQSENGNARAFRCPYHGWTYRASGALLGVPYRSGYGPDGPKYANALTRVPRVDTYRGFIFASWDPGIKPLTEYLAGATARIDRFVDASPTGEISLTAGVQRVRLRTSWKFFMENSVENYHQNFVHQAPLFSHPALKKTATRVSGDSSAALVRDLGNGHAELDFAPEQRSMGRVHRTSSFDAPPRVYEEYERALAEAYGEGKARDLIVGGPPHVFVFPNLMLLQQDVRNVVPVGPSECIIEQRPALLEGVSDEINWARVRRQEQAYGPAGSILPDDIEIWERNDRALGTRTPTKLDLSRGSHRESVDEDGYPVSHITDELGNRAIWNKYVGLISS